MKLSVGILTYNQAQYIQQCLDSVLMQVTDFDYEIVVGDDASVDGTQEILYEYVPGNRGASQRGSTQEATSGMSS